MTDEPDDYEIPLEGYEAALGNDLSALQARIEQLEAEILTVKKSLTIAQTKLAKAVEALEVADQAIMENATDQDLLMWGEPTVSHIRTILAELKGQDDE